MTASRKDQSRREHYGIFYGIHPLPPEDGRPLVLVHGNCQAESVRVLLSAAGSGVRTVRVPPAHELVTDDLAHLQRLLAQVDLLVSQPVRDDYRGLPLGTRQLRDAAPAAARVVIFPVIRWAALHPFQVIVRSPEAGEPPIVPYHDLRTLSLVAGGAGAMPVLPAPTAVRAVREHSLGQLRERQQRHGAIDVTDLLLAAGRGACQVINHPGNAVLSGLARRVLEAGGVDGVVAEPDRILLNSVHAPVLPEVLDALGVGGEGRGGWTVEGRDVSDEEVQAAQLRWYAEHPGVAEAGLRRHADVARLLAR